MSEEAGSIIQKISERSRAEAESVVSTAKRVAQREVDSARRRARTREGVLRRELDARSATRRAQAESEAASEAQRLMLERRHEMVERTIRDALAVLADGQRDDAYFDLLVSLACDAVAQLGAKDAFIIVSPRDREWLGAEGRFEKLVSRVKEEASAAVSLSDETIDSSGGLVAASGDGKVRYYNTFEEIAYRKEAFLRERLSEHLFQVQK